MSDEIDTSYINNLLPLQQQVIAEAALAGCKVERLAGPTTRRVRRRQERYMCHLPDGTFVGHFPDLYEASLRCLYALRGFTNARRDELNELFKLTGK